VSVKSLDPLVTKLPVMVIFLPIQSIYPGLDGTIIILS